MRISEIRLQNLRAFEDFQLALEPRLTLLVGRNASGKSSVLEGIAIALGAWLSGFRSIKEDHTIEKSAARLVESTVNGVAVTDTAFPVRVEADGSFDGSMISWARELRHLGGRTTTGESAELRKIAVDLEDRLVHSGGQTPVDDQEVTLPVMAYYGTGRLWIQRRGSSNDVSRNRPTLSRLDGYRAALDAASDHKGLEAWMARLEQDRIQRLARADDENRPLRDVRSPQLEAISSVACSCLEHATRFYYSANHRQIFVQFNDGAPPTPFAALSDGQRTLIALAADIAWRATQLNPHQGAKAAERATGVVLIDELELHLHPAWQQRVLDDLLRAFPEIQFIVTTHSPQIMSTAPARSVRLLDTNHSAQPIEMLAGKDTNSILEDIFGVPARPQPWQDKLDQLGLHIENREFDAARAILQELTSDWGADDTNVVDAQWELALAEHSNAED